MATETMTLTPAQALAYDQLLPFLQGRHEASLAVLEGYAGTGKTFLVSRLLMALLQAAPGLKIAVAAPTNKAVRVLRDKLTDAGVPIADDGDFVEADHGGRRSYQPEQGCTCRSIHSHLGLKLRELENGQQEISTDRESTLREYDLVVVDECSMLDQFLFEKIVGDCWFNKINILFVGDPAQLPPVKEATISPVFDQVNFKVRLAEVVRQARENPIIQLSMRLRDLIEVGVKASALDLIEALPDLATQPKAGLVRGRQADLVAWWLSQTQEDAPGSDVRIIAYTNDRVQWYNRAIHQALHGDTETRFVKGERVIVHTQCTAQRYSNPALQITEPDRLITSEELTVMETILRHHPFFPDIPAEKVLLRSDHGQLYSVFIARDEVALNRRIDACFAQWRALKMQLAKLPNDHADYDRIKQAKNEASNEGWELRRAFAPLRHAYAITCHKSQGSTFDCALVDFSDLAKMPDPFQFNRALYVAVTRSREYLALVVT